MYTRRRFYGHVGLAPAMFSMRPFLLSLGAEEEVNLPSRLPAPVISAKAHAFHSRAFVFDGHVHALDREFLLWRQHWYAQRKRLLGSPSCKRGRGRRVFHVRLYPRGVLPQSLRDEAGVAANRTRIAGSSRKIVTS